MTRIIDRSQFRKPPEAPQKPGPRKCLRCQSEFKSKGVGNQICRKCKYENNKRTFDAPTYSCHTTVEDVPTSDLSAYW